MSEKNLFFKLFSLRRKRLLRVCLSIHFIIMKTIICILLAVLLYSLCVAQSEPISFGNFRLEVSHFIRKEILVSLQSLQEPANTPKEILNLPIGGSFTWASWAVSLARYAKLSGDTIIENYYLPSWIQTNLLKEVPEGKTFAQLYAAECFWLFQQNNENLLFKNLDDSSRQQLIALTDVRRYISEDSLKTVYPTNYYAVAALTMAYRSALGWEQNPIFTRRIIDTCVYILKANNGFMDDDKQGRGRYDRYLQEFIRFTYLSAKINNHQKALTELKPMVRHTAKLWWDMLSPVTYHSSPYGRSLQNSWEDTWEQTAFFLQNPQLAPTSLENLVAIFQKSYLYYRKYEYNEETHTNRMLDKGRATYGYAGVDRIWQYSVGALGKLACSLNEIATVTPPQTLIKEPIFPYCDKWYWLRKKPEKMGIWAYRSKKAYFVIPVVGAFKGSPVSDYQHVPYGLPIFAHPVQQKVPNLMPYIKVGDSTYTFGNNGVVKVKKSTKKLSLTYRNAYHVASGYLADRGICANVQYYVKGDSVLQSTIYLTNKTNNNLLVDSLILYFPLCVDNVSAKQNGALDTHLIIDQQEKVYFNTSFLPQVRLFVPQKENLKNGAFKPNLNIIELLGEKIKITPNKSIRLTWEYKF